MAKFQKKTKPAAPVAKPAPPVAAAVPAPTALGYGPTHGLIPRDIAAEIMDELTGTDELPAAAASAATPAAADAAPPPALAGHDIRVDFAIAREGGHRQRRVHVGTPDETVLVFTTRPLFVPGPLAPEIAADAHLIAVPVYIAAAPADPPGLKTERLQ